MFCRYCGTQLPDDAKFCSKCGNSIAEPETIIHKSELSPKEVPNQETPKIIEMPQEPAPKVDWATASKMDKELNKPRSPASVPKIVCIISGCLCGVILLFTIFGKIANNSKTENKKPSSSTDSTKVEETVQPAPIPEPEPEPEEIGVADPMEPSTWIYCTGEEEWYESAMLYGEDFNYNEWEYYNSKYENDDYSDPEDDPSAWDNMPDSDRISDNVGYFDWHKPFGYFLGLNTYLEIESAMSILYDAELDKIQLSFYDAESAQYGYDVDFSLVEPVSIAYIDPVIFPDNEWITFHPEGEDSDVTAKFKIYVWHSMAANDPNDNRGDHIDIEIEDYGNHPAGSIYLSMAFNTYYNYYGGWNSTHSYPY
ncbi:MAG: zinc-ribbon domain-containing protein [Oscillibacter sp.]|nr:zinc-ribbon domain-containing protein [Oscillibacter sp.]